MPQNEVLAAIDIGSNAVRMVIAGRTRTEMKVLKKFRFPIRLGGDVFEKGKISSRNLKEAARTFKKFKKLMSEYNIRRYRAVGTSALREARNSQAFTELISRHSDLLVEIIDGVEEARLIHLAVKNELELDHHRCLLIDVGGGSTEVTVSDSASMIATQSFPFGTVRTLETLKKKHATEAQLPQMMAELMDPLSHFLKSQKGKLEFAIGTGGNLETLGKLKPLLLGKNARTFLTVEEISMISEVLKKTSLKERVERLEMRPDRADVILPAIQLVQTIMRQANVDKIMIPYVGLKDGLLWDLVRRSN